MVCYECEACDFRTKFKGDFKRHQKTKKHEKKHAVLKENETINKKNMLFPPIPSNFPPIPSNFPPISLQFPSNSLQFPSDLENSNLTHNSATCFLENDLETQKKHVKKHVKKHAKKHAHENLDLTDKHATCFFEEKKDEIKKHVKKHVKKHAKKHAFENNEIYKNEFDEIIYICELCSKSFTRKDNYNRHIQYRCKKLINEDDDNEYVSDNENEKFNTQNNTNTNININNDNDIDKNTIMEEISLLKNEIEVIRNENTKLKKNINIEKINVYINMAPIKLLNQKYIDNPSLKSIEDYIENTDYSDDELRPIKDGADSKSNSVIANTINSIILKANKELISRNNITGACFNAIFINDGSARQYIAKGPNEWDYYKDDSALDNIVLKLLDKTIKCFNYHPIFINKKSRNKIIKIIKSNNDYANEKTELINSILQLE